MIPHFYYHPRMMEYDFGPKHPLKPVRLARTMSLLRAMVPSVQFIDPGLATEDDLLRVHDEEFVDVVRRIYGEGVGKEELFTYGFGSVDTPPFAGIWGASLGYCGGGVAAAKALVEGAQLSYNMGGGLHHSQSNRASGFCVFNDPAISLAILKERFGKLLYVDIDLHHGDGVQAIWLDDPDVVTLSIHESGKTLYPGTGFVHEEGANGSAVNIPLDAYTTGDVWLKAFTEIFPRVLDRFRPEVIVLQMGCDPHIHDPLGHLQVTVQEWLGAVKHVRDTRLPILACGGGGYEMSNVPRMWAAAVMTLANIEVPKLAPSDIPVEWGVGSLFDPTPTERGIGLASAQGVIEYWRRKLG
jgi:acetoin utilization protein AcuC